jgi:hypothetical protein
MFQLMRTHVVFKALLLAVIANLAFTGCGGLRSEGGPGPIRTYQVKINSSEPGTRIEVNGKSVGTAPVVVKIRGGEDRSFYDLRNDELVVRAYPQGTGRPAQVKVFRMTARFDKIPERVYFDLTPLIDSPSMF